MGKVYNFMSSPVIKIDLNVLLKDAIDKMVNNNISALLVEKEGNIIGIITKTDWHYLILSQTVDPNTLKVSTIMSYPIITIDRNETMQRAGFVLEKNKIRHLAVTELGQIKGILSTKDLEDYYLKLHDSAGVPHY